MPDDLPGEVKPELMQSVLEVATLPVRGRRRGRRSSSASCAAASARSRPATGSRSAPPAPTPRRSTRTSRSSTQPRYQELAAELGWIAQRELIFGTHVHVGIDDAEKAIYVADGMRGYLPLLLGMSSNSPLWRGKTTGMMSSRTPVFRAFPRVGIPPYYGSWEIYSHRVEQMMRGGAIPDYTYLWWDVRPHPNLGTVELRVFDQQTRVEHTIGFAALRPVARPPARRCATTRACRASSTRWELIDDNKVRAALVGIEGKLIDFDRGVEVPGGGDDPRA